MTKGSEDLLCVIEQPRRSCAFNKNASCYDRVESKRPAATAICKCEPQPKMDSVLLKGPTGTLALTVCAAAVGGTLQYGYNIAIIDAPTAHICTFINDTWRERRGTRLEAYQVTLIWSFVVSVFSLGGLLGSLLAGPLAVRFGRKRSLLLNNVFLGLSSVLSVSSRTARSFEMIILARLLVGINAGVSMNVQPMYFGESAPKHLRGAAALSSAVFTAFGVLLGQVVGLRELLGGESWWPYLLASGVVPGVIQLLTLPWFPESPCYLLIDRGDKEACVKALRQLWGRDDLGADMEQILQEQGRGGGARAKRPWELFGERSVRWQLLSVMAVSSAMQLCGNDAIYFYASSVFREAGISSDRVQYATIGTGACEFTATNLLIEHLGRRLLLIGGYVLMACWALTVDGMPYLCMTCIFAYILSFGLGPAGVTGVLPTEIFNQTARPAAYTIAGSLMWINFFLVGMVFPFLVSELGELCFIPFCAVCLLCSLYVGFALPETKGKTLSEITHDFDSTSPNAKLSRSP
uniref:Solute carrier family 2, facilitated glucose transporter member 5 n=1 Tax=Scleropages formosus TaxID=113540 RepID=A0A8C9TEW2_SCLFO